MDSLVNATKMEKDLLRHALVMEQESMQRLEDGGKEGGRWRDE